MSWKEVNILRKKGDIPAAKALAYELLADNPKDFRVRSELEWCVYFTVRPALDSAKEAVKGDKRPRQHDLRLIDEALSEFARIPAERPGMACSVLLGQLCRIVPDYPRFAAFVAWVGLEGLREEDWSPSEYQGKPFPPLALQVARALTKWAKHRADVTQDRWQLALEWLDAVRPSATGDDALWLDWDRAGVLRRLGQSEEAAKALSDVLRAKRNEFWGWAEAARLYLHDDPDLALSCFCRALECPAEPGFVAKVHRELAELLADRGEHAQASREIVTAVAARGEQGWAMGPELEALMAEPWFDQEATGAQNPKSFYADHSGQALSLCFDNVITAPATFSGLEPPSPADAAAGRQRPARSRFTIRDDEGLPHAITGPRMRKSKWKPGYPCSLVRGLQADDPRGVIVQIVPRPEGSAWDCLSPVAALVTRNMASKKPRIFVDRDRSDVEVDEASSPALPADVGQGVTAQLTRIGNRWLAFSCGPGPLPDKDVKLICARLKRAQHGNHAFVDDVFVSPDLLRDIDTDITDVAVVAVFAWHEKNQRFSWRAISVKPAS